MLQLPQLDDTSYEQLFTRARSLIPTFTGEWTDFNDHDPGITLLQLYAWLCDLLNYYMDASGEVHRLKYLKLLGLAPDPAPARCVLGLRAREPLPSGTRFAAGETVFELAEPWPGGENRLVSLSAETGGRMEDLLPLAGADGGFAPVFAPGGGRSALYLGFEGPLTGCVRLYVQAGRHEGRNPFGPGFSLARLGWEVFDGRGWVPARVLEDGTCGLLQSGFLVLEAGGGSGPLEHPLLPRGHYLRCAPLEGGYDLAPLLGRVTAGCARAVQRDTHSRVLEYVYDGGPIRLDWPVREGDLLTVAVRRGGGRYVVWFRGGEDDLCEVEAGPEPWRRTVRFDRGRFGAAPEPGDAAAVVVTRAEELEGLRLGVTDGCSGQRFDFPAEGLCELRLALCGEEGGRPAFELWDLCGDLGRAGWDDRVFAREGGRLVFGDGLHGLQPERGLAVYAATLSFTRFGEGNVRRGQVNRALDAFAAGCAAENLDDAAGGRFPERSEELEARLEELLTAPRRAVTPEDYRRLAQSAPGLLIDLVNVIPMREYCACYGGAPAPDTVLVAVKPAAGGERPELGEGYRRRIQAHLDQHRLLTSGVRVIPARYAGIAVNGRVQLRENSAENREMVRRELLELVDFSHTRRFGQRICCGRLFSKLELLPCVRAVRRLFIETEDGCAAKDEHGDIIVYPDALAYLARVGIEFS